jgi:hypothetical protein
MKRSKYLYLLLAAPMLLVLGCETSEVRDLNPGTAFAKFTLNFES